MSPDPHGNAGRHVSLGPLESSVWQTSQRSLTYTGRPLVMGILNVTPDSFSDGGRFSDPASFDGAGVVSGSKAVELAVDAALQMQADGADIIDIGGESTRPYSDPVDAEQEIQRVVPVIEGLSGRLSIPISIDTSKAMVAKAALDAGAEIINDVTGLEGDPAMMALACQSQAGVCVMHMQGTPQTMQDAPSYADVVEEIRQYLIQRRDACLAAGIELQRICLDPGIGFGKTHQHNFQLMRGVERFLDLGCVCLIGHSRKGFIKKRLAGATEKSGIAYDPLAGTLGVSLAAAVAGAHVLRVHDVRETVQAIDLFQACREPSKS
ncbi:Dihydropteroate synthase [Neorhodopirellula lusitana]|uniref:Dihydropteroate synthase n=1 Tax=Neorhodopirellula lusitana TaxID=445327 RepID=A0ABY1PP20_9BACT|nr:dihydropteroate synthase [Neorhodopirellula lusitana]SMP39300.1 Dihydropteroate synthase [Neorhodopirellula lusitana]